MVPAEVRPAGPLIGGSPCELQQKLLDLIIIACCVQACVLRSQQLSRLQDVLVHRLLPRLSLRALQSFSQSCKAARAAVRGLPDRVLLRLAQVGSLSWPAASE